jgi:hypothetical protein
MAGALVRVGKSRVVRNTVATAIKRAIAAAKKAKGKITKAEMVRIARKVRAKFRASKGLSKKGSAIAVTTSAGIGAGATEVQNRKNRKKKKRR